MNDNNYDDLDLDLDLDLELVGEQEEEISRRLPAEQVRSAQTRGRSKRKPKKKKNKAMVYFTRFLITLLLTVLLLVAGIYSVMLMLVHGPSKTARELFVVSVRETSAIGFLANWFFTEEEIKDIIARNSIKDTDEITDISLFQTPEDPTQSGGEEKEMPDIEIIDIKGPTYKGKLMIIKDPSRVFVGTVPSFAKTDGMVVSQIAKRYNAIGGINGGEFIDGVDGATYTAMPVGLVMTNGEVKNGSFGATYHVTGLTKDNILVVGNMSAQQAIDMGVRDCVSIANNIGPFLVINGEVQEVNGMGGGVNPRTAIGQRADKAILMLAIDGRQPNSIGATFADLAYIMQEYGAVNASTMDGGTSTQMYYDGEVINTPYSPTGPRQCPTAFIVGGTE